MKNENNKKTPLLRVAAIVLVVNNNKIKTHRRIVVLVAVIMAADTVIMAGSKKGEQGFTPSKNPEAKELCASSAEKVVKTDLSTARPKYMRENIPNICIRNTQTCSFLSPMLSLWKLSAMVVVDLHANLK